jgi:hypothetical protein
MLNTFFTSLGGWATPPQTPVETYGRLYVIAGQSNAAGTNTGTMQLPAHLRVVQPNVYYADLRAADRDLRPVDGTIDKTNAGMEYNIGYLLHQHLQEPIYIAKYAVGGSPLTYSSTTTNWHPTATPGYWTTGLNTRLKELLDKMALEGKAPKVVTFIWYQGESDIDNSQSYEADLRLLFEAFRNTNYNNYYLNGANVKIQLVQIKKWSSNTGIDAIRAIQATVAADQPNTYLVDANPFESSPTDAIHLTTKGQCDLAEAIFNSIIT